jgi:cell division protein FtsL
MKEQQKEVSRLMISQAWLVKNVPFFLFLSSLAVLYIYNGHHAEKYVKDINRTSRELKELQYEFKMVRSEWMFMTKQSEVVEAVKGQGLKEITEPPVVLDKALRKTNKPVE